MADINHYEESLVAEFCESEFATRSRGFLVQHAAQVVYIAKMSRSTRLTAAFLSARFKRNFSRRPIEDILKKVKLKEIVVTPEQLSAAARQHPRAEHFAEMCPEALDPNSQVKIKNTPTPSPKNLVTTGRQTKKSATEEVIARRPEVTTNPEPAIKPTTPPVERKAKEKFSLQPGGSNGLRQICTNEELEEKRRLIAQSKRELGRE